VLLAPSDRRWEGTAFTPSRPNIAKESRLHPNESCLYFGAGGHPRNHPQLGRGVCRWRRASQYSRNFESYERNKKECISIAAKCINSQLNVRLVPLVDLSGLAQRTKRLRIAWVAGSLPAPT
jgi:hypothetical protein